MSHHSNNSQSPGLFFFVPVSAGTVGLMFLFIHPVIGISLLIIAAIYMAISSSFSEAAERRRQAAYAKTSMGLWEALCAAEVAVKEAKLSRNVKKTLRAERDLEDAEKKFRAAAAADQAKQEADKARAQKEAEKAAAATLKFEAELAAAKTKRARSGRSVNDAVLVILKIAAGIVAFAIIAAIAKGP